VLTFRAYLLLGLATRPEESINADGFSTIANKNGRSALIIMGGMKGFLQQEVSG
jgi:hypothetical protein